MSSYVRLAGIVLIVAALVTPMAGCVERPSKDLEIRDWYDLDAVRDNLAGHHRLMNSLDATTPGYDELAGPRANGGRGWVPIGAYDDPFVGIFDGQGHKISDLFVGRPEENWIGLFAAVGEAGVIASIGVVNAAVSGSLGVGGLVGENMGAVVDSYSSGSVIGGLGVGGLVAGNLGTVTKSYSAVNVTGNLGVGGLVGINYEGTVDNCYSTGSVRGNLWATGGLVGGNDGTVVNSYSTGSVAGDSFVGGLAGHNAGTVRNCYSSGNVTGETDVGGLVGYDDDGTVTNSFWDVEASGTEESDGGTGKTTAEMKDITTFTDTATEGLDEPWDITAVAPGESDQDYIWNIVDGQTYPFLSWESVH